jgi:type IV pilus assembly protein PilQ
MKSKSFFIHLFVVALAGCAAPNTQVVSPAEERVTTITDLRVEDLPDVTRVVVSGDGPLNYTAFRLDDPIEFILDLAATNLGAFAEPRPVGVEPVTEIVPEQAEAPQQTARLVFKLSAPADYQVARDDMGTNLTIDFAKLRAVETPVASPLVEEVAPAPTASPEPTTTAPVASRITSVRILPQKAFVDVVVGAEGPVGSPNVFTIKDSRLVIDFPDALSAVKASVVKAEANTLVTQARVGQHRDPQKVRVVLDLKKAVAYTITPHESGVAVRLTTAASSAPKPTDAPQGAPAPAEVAPAAGGATVTAPAAPVEPRPSPEPVAAAPSAEADQALALSPQFVNAGPRTIGDTGFTGQKISLDFQDAEVSNVLRLIADVSDLNLVVGDEVKGKTTLKLFNVPWDQALDIILKSKGLGQVREGNIIRIDSNSNIAKQQDEAAKAKDAQTKAEDLKTAIIPINYAKAADLSTTLKKNLSSRGELTVNEPTNSLIAKDVERVIKDIQQLIKLLDLPNPQVLIETRIVQANTNFARDLGVQWGASFKETSGVNQFGLNAGATGGINAQAPAFAVNLPATGAAGPVGNIGFQFGRLTGVNPVNLDLRVSAGEALGETKLISSPRIVTMDNKEALIQQGDSIPYETVSDRGTQTQFVDATLNLTVTPHITPNGSVIMKIKATKNAIGSFTSTRTGAPSISKREASTEVMVQDGETTVIGGIFETSKTESVTGVPWIYRVPVIGWFFKRESVSTTNQELLIFITPTIVKRV